MLNLRSGYSSLQLVPEHGGAIFDWRFAHKPVLRAVKGLGCFPLIPYANRIANGKFKWRGFSCQVPLNFGDHPHSIHGIGWQRPWKVEGSGTDNARLTLAHDGFGGWPFRFTAEQYFELTPDSLRIELRMTNRHTEAAPAGLGLHPYFRRPPGATLRFNAQTVWLTDPTALPIGQSAVPDALNPTNGLDVNSVRLDNCFSGWDGIAHLDFGAVRLTIEASDAFRHLQVYTPHGEDFFCLEPVTHRPDAINTANAMTALPAGETLSGSVTFRMTETPPS
jgi:aldose 1-epimerase